MGLLDLFRTKVEPETPKPRPVYGTDVLPAVNSVETRIGAWRRTFQQPEPKAEGYALDNSEGTRFPKFTNFQDGVPDAQVAWYASQGFIGYQMMAIISQQWLVDKCCTVPGDDAIRLGFTTTVTSGKEVSTEVLDDLAKIDDEMKLRENLSEFVNMGRRFGLRLALFVVDSTDPKYYEEPFNIDGIKPGTYRGISQIDPTWVSPVLTGRAIADPAAMNFYEPTYWVIQGKRYHKSHFVIFRGSPVADILKPTYFYGGVSITQKVYDRVYAAERTANEAPQLAMTKRLITYKMNMEEGIANEKGLIEKISRWVQFMSNYGVKLIGEGEEVTAIDTTLADLDAVIMTQYQLVAAAANVPVTKLMGTQPKGFNSNGEYEEATYREELETIQTHDLTPLIIRHHQLAIKSILKMDFETGVQWNPLDSPTATEQADINLKKAQTDEALINAGSIAPSESRARVIEDPMSGYNGLPPDFPEDEIEEDPQDEPGETDAEKTDKGGGAGQRDGDGDGILNE